MLEEKRGGGRRRRAKGKGGRVGEEGEGWGMGERTATERDWREMHGEV